MLNFYREYFSSGELQHFLLQSLPLLLRIPSKEFKKKKDLEEVIEVAKEGAQPFPFDQNAFDVALRASIKAVFASQSRRNAGSDKQIPEDKCPREGGRSIGIILARLPHRHPQEDRSHSIEPRKGQSRTSCFDRYKRRNFLMAPP